VAQLTLAESLLSSLQISGSVLVAGFIVILVVLLIVIFNGLMCSKNDTDKAWANIDVLLKKRLDLIPQLVDVVRSYTEYEQTVLEEIARIRADSLSAAGVAENARRSNAMSSSLQSLFALGENYPDLKASEEFLALQKEISSIETQIAERREFYNESVRIFNTRISTIPGLIIAIPLRFRPLEYFQTSENVAVLPDTDFRGP
jgi:LemA protein